MIQKSVNNSLEYSMESPRQKIIFIGDSGVGKTTMIKNINEEPYMDLRESSIGIDFYSKKIFYKGTEIRLQIWDTAGQEKYKGLIPGYIRNTALVFLVYDITSIESFQHLNEWIEFIKSLENVKIVLCGNKIDLKNERQVTKKEGEDFAKERNMVFHEVSARENINMAKMFYRCMAELPYFDDKIDDNQISREILYKELLKENGIEINGQDDNIKEITKYNGYDKKETSTNEENKNVNGLSDTIHIYYKKNNDVKSSETKDNKKETTEKQDNKMGKKKQEEKKIETNEQLKNKIEATSRSTFALNEVSSSSKRKCPC